MGQALYRKYRSKSLSEIVGQQHIISTLQNALKNGHISHAYLFTGPRGVGKTSIARILAHEVNQLPYTDESIHIDIIEIDAASNRRIDEIRDLRDKVHIAPTSAKYKVYIIDEVHMLTREAFNALLKTLEEPPAHVIFILATTEVHKLPETIVSRTQRFNFKPIETPDAIKSLRSIAKKEKIDIDDEALKLIAEHGEGSFRDSISLLDQVSSYGGRVAADDIRANLGIAPQAIIEQLYKAIMDGSPADLLNNLQIIQEQGYDASQLAKQLGGAIRAMLLSADRSLALILTRLLGKLIEVPASYEPTASLQVVLLETNLSQNSQVDEPEVRTVAVTAEPAAAVQTQAKKPKPEKSATVQNTPKIVPKDEDFDQTWLQTLNDVKKGYNTLYGVLRMAQASRQGNTVVLAFQFPFHQKRLKDTKNHQIVADLLAQRLGDGISLQCEVDATVKLVTKPVIASPPAVAKLPDSISNIFGAAEVLES